jgi:hypothetical protein
LYFVKNATERTQEQQNQGGGNFQIVLHNIGSPARFYRIQLSLKQGWHNGEHASKASVAMCSVY